MARPPPSVCTAPRTLHSIRRRRESGFSAIATCRETPTSPSSTAVRGTFQSSAAGPETARPPSACTAPRTLHSTRRRRGSGFSATATRREIPTSPSSMVGRGIPRSSEDGDDVQDHLAISYMSKWCASIHLSFASAILGLSLYTGRKQLGHGVRFIVISAGWSQSSCQRTSIAVKNGGGRGGGAGVRSAPPTCWLEIARRVEIVGKGRVPVAVL